MSQVFLPHAQTLPSPQLAGRLPPFTRSPADAATTGVGAHPKTTITNWSRVPGQGEGFQLENAGTVASNAAEQNPRANAALPEYVVYELRPNWKSSAWRRLQSRGFLTSSDENKEEDVEWPSHHHTREVRTPQDSARDGPHSSPEDPLRQDKVREKAHRRWDHLRLPRHPPRRQSLVFRGGGCRRCLMYKGKTTQWRWRCGRASVQPGSPVLLAGDSATARRD